MKDQLLKYCKASFLILTAEKINYKIEFDKNFVNNKINAVYVGWLSKINKEWIYELSKQSNINIKLVGPYNQNDYKDPDNIENISLLGEKQGKNLISILKKADVCLAPYKICKDTEEVYTMPNKFWLYLNFGLPIVTCEIKTYLNYQTILFIRLKTNLNL